MYFLLLLCHKPTLSYRSLDIGNQMNASEETKVTNVGSQVRKYVDYSNFGKKCLTECFISGGSDL